MVEFDALPDLGNEAVPTKTPHKDGITNGHGCGHNLIGSGAIGAALALKSHMEKEGISGILKVFGCPAEELLSGKNYMAKASAFNGLDACLHWHPAPVNTLWNLNSTAASDFWFERHRRPCRSYTLERTKRLADEQVANHTSHCVKKMHLSGGIAPNVMMDMIRSWLPSLKWR